MKTKVLLLIFLAITSIVFAQTYVLEWQGPDGFYAQEIYDDFFTTPATFDMNDDDNPELIFKNYDGENTTINVYNPCSNYDLIWTHQISGDVWIIGFGNITDTTTNEMIYGMENEEDEEVYVINISTYESTLLGSGQLHAIIYDIDGDGKDEVILDSDDSPLEIWGDGTQPAVDDKIIQAPKLKLSQNYPNPFNPTTTINYQLKKSGYIELKIYNIKGQLVDALVKGNQNAGNHSVIWNAKGFSSGQYFYQISVDEKLTKAKKAICVK